MKLVYEEAQAIVRAITLRLEKHPVTNNEREILQKISDKVTCAVVNKQKHLKLTDDQADYVVIALGFLKRYGGLFPAQIWPVDNAIERIRSRWSFHEATPEEIFEEFDDGRSSNGL